MDVLAVCTVVLAVILGLIGLLKLGLAIFAFWNVEDIPGSKGGLIYIIISVTLFVVRFNFM